MILLNYNSCQSKISEIGIICKTFIASTTHTHTHTPWGTVRALLTRLQPPVRAWSQRTFLQMMPFGWSRLMENVAYLAAAWGQATDNVKNTKRTPQLFYTCRSYMSRSQVPISTLCQRRFWTVSRALCLFVFSKKGQLSQWCQRAPGSLICESLTVGLLPSQLLHRCVCDCVCVWECVGGARCLNRTQISDSFFFL